MAFDRFLIAPINTGMQTDLKSWMIPDDAFENLNNAYVFRGRVRKRFGSELMAIGPSSATYTINSRLRIALGTYSQGSFYVPGVIFKIGQAFSVGNDLFTVYQLGTPADMYSTNPASSGMYNTTTGQVTITGAYAGGTPVYFYPAEPVLGITDYQLSQINNQLVYAFDTQFAYTYTNANAWQLSGTITYSAGPPPIAVTVTPTWQDPTGNKLGYMWTCNWESKQFSGDILINPDIMFVTNFQVTNRNGPGTVTDDPLWYYYLTPYTNVPLWAEFYPYFQPGGLAPMTGPFVQTCRIIVAFKNRLVLLNTVENDNNITMEAPYGTNTWYPNRARWSFDGQPLAVNAWYEPNQIDNVPNKSAGASFQDAPTDEQIVSAEFIKDRLIVYFERSTWELVFTGNQILPFRWQKINTELGSESTFATVPFDKAVLTIGNTGVHACTGANVERIDIKIPDEVFHVATQNQATLRVQGIRDYFAEMVYWCFPPNSEDPAEMYPSRVFVYNYRNNSWAFNDDCITAFGYYLNQIGETWANAQYPWQSGSNSWSSGYEATNERKILAGNPEGFVFVIDTDLTRNAPYMQVTNAVPGANSTITLTIIDHTLSEGDYIYIENFAGPTTGLVGNIFEVLSLVNPNTTMDDGDTIIIAGPMTGTYAGGATATRVSNITILTKRFNPYVGKSRNVFIQRIDFAVQKTAYGEVVVDYYPSSTYLSMVQAGTTTGTILGTNILETFPDATGIYPLEQFQNLLWHTVYFQTSGEFIQLNIYMNQSQMLSTTTALEDFQMEGMLLHTAPTSDRLQ
jgi:hypothetical protein